MKLLIQCCQTRLSPSAILELPFQCRRHTARLVTNEAQISPVCLVEPHNFALGGADGEAHIWAHMLNIVS